MPRSRRSLLLNAEPFGFGPAAAIASFFPHLRSRFTTIGYIGTDHTLDLQRDLPYDAVHDVTGRTAQEIDGIMGGYDAFLTALDFGMAARARANGLTTCIYDPLTWYWPRVPAVARACDAYIAQDFIGVRERLKKMPGLAAKAHVVPPIIGDARRRRRGEHVLINFGGLFNPFWSIEEVASYARIVLAAIRESLPSGEKVVVTTSSAIAKRLGDPSVKRYARESMNELFARTKYAFMTPGLGNIYDAARFGIPTVWLPPANDSQGQQLVALRRKAFCDEWIDWGDFLPRNIDYKAAQPQVLRAITKGIHALEESSAVRGRLADVFAQRVIDIVGVRTGAAAALLERYGSGGAKEAAEIVARQSRNGVA